MNIEIAVDQSSEGHLTFRIIESGIWPQVEFRPINLNRLDFPEERNPVIRELLVGLTALPGIDREQPAFLRRDGISIVPNGIEDVEQIIKNAVALFERTLGAEARVTVNA